MANEVLEKVFDAAMLLIAAEGGDGDAQIVCRWNKFEKVVQRFEEYNERLSHKFTKIADGEKYVVYGDSQENLMIGEDGHWMFPIDQTTFYCPTIII